MYSVSLEDARKVVGGATNPGMLDPIQNPIQCPVGTYPVDETHQYMSGGGGGGSLSGGYKGISGSAGGGGGSSQQGFNSYNGCVPDGYFVSFTGPNGAPELKPLPKSSTSGSK